MVARYPLAVSGGSPVPIEDAEENQTYSCVACRQPMEASPSEPEPHFRHVADQDARSCDSNLALHRVVIYYIKRGIESGAYVSRWTCPRVERTKGTGWDCEPASLDLGADCLKVEPRLRIVPTTDSDLVARYSTRDPVIIDVVNQRQPSPETQKAYRDLGYIVFLVSVTWEKVEPLKSGTEGAEVLNGLCRKCLTWKEWMAAWVRGEPWAMAWVKER